VNNYSEQFAIEVFDQIAYFAGYGFNKSHSVPYALLAYQTAYLKANYPAEYLAASLTAVKRDKDRTAVFLAEAREMGVNVSTPDINLSSADFTVNDNEILFGLSAVRNVGDITADKIVKERIENGNFESVEEFLSRIDSRSLNKRGIEALIQGGGFDKFGHTRKGLFQSCIDLIEDAKNLKSEKANNQASLFNLEEHSSNQTSISKTEWAKKEFLEREREMLGFFVSEDPLDGYGDVLKSESTHSIIELLNTEEDQEDDLNVVIAGLISNVQKRVSRRGNPWIQFDLQDVTGSTGVLLFNKLVDKYNSSVDGEIYLKVSGTYVGGTENIIRARDIQVIDPSKMVENLDTSPLRIAVDTNKLDKNNMILLRELLEKHPGLSDVELEVTDSSGTRLMHLNELRVKKTNQLKNEISTLLSN
jgi:DNA polymerase-3 subunit alpha